MICNWVKETQSKLFTLGLDMFTHGQPSEPGGIYAVTKMDDGCSVEHSVSS